MRNAVLKLSNPLRESGQGRPLNSSLDQILRYEACNHRRLVSLSNQLGRLQRARKEEKGPLPTTV